MGEVIARNAICLYEDPCYRFSCQYTNTSCPQFDLYNPEVLYGMSLASFVVTALCALFITIQLHLVVYYRHKIFCYRTALLGVCLSWAVLRSILFMYYWLNGSGFAAKSETGYYWLLYSLPICLQFSALCMIGCYFMQVAFQMMFSSRRDFCKYVIVICSCAFIVISIILAVEIKTAVSTSPVPCNFLSSGAPSPSQYEPITNTLRLIKTRVAISSIFFIILGFVLSGSIFVIALDRSQHSRLMLETEGLTVARAVCLGGSVVLLCATRALYNILALIPSFSFVNDTDQMELFCDTNDSFISFIVAMFVFELLPTIFMIYVFRVRKPIAIHELLSEESSPLLRGYCSTVAVAVNPFSTNIFSRSPESGFGSGPASFQY